MIRNRLQLIFVFLLSAYFSFSQNHKADSTNPALHFSGSIGITQNGIALVPTFSLGKPAGIVMLSMGKKKFSIDPEFRFALEGRHSSFVFIYRHNAINRSKFQLTFGGHIPGLNFVTTPSSARSE